MADPRLSAPFLTLPLAHRGLHEPGTSALENSLPAFAAALDHGYGIELDVQMSRDGQAMVFHDDTLDRLTAEGGPVRARDAVDLERTALAHGAGTIPRLRTVLDLVAGKVPLLIEVKDQDGALGKGVGALEAAVARDLQDYAGPVALMSFNPCSVAALRDHAPDIARGRVTENFRSNHWHDVPAGRRTELRRIDDLGDLGATFISHGRHDLFAPRVAELKARGIDILTWTIRSLPQEEAARHIAQNITFEGYLAAIPG